MKTKEIFSTIAIVLMTTLTAFATIHRVDNNAANNPDFTSAQAAHDASLSGDTLYIAGSSISYGNLVITKTIYIFGSGYFLNENPETQVKTVSAKFGEINFNAGSDGSLLTGFHFTGYTININANNITIKRNLHIKIAVGNDKSNIIITQNYSAMTGPHTLIHIGSFCQNIIIRNNFFENTHPWRVISSQGSSSLEVQNNILNGYIEVYNTLFYNNILRTVTYIGAGNDVRNNICFGNPFGTTANGNQANVDMTTVFVGTGSTDGKWQLAPGSPAIGAGVNGEDCGMFGGDDSYVLSGLPNIPAIYFFDAPISGSNIDGLPVHVKIKSHK